jgi:hypothetical protein
MAEWGVSANTEGGDNEFFKHSCIEFAEAMKAKYVCQSSELYSLLVWVVEDKHVDGWMGSNLEDYQCL